MKELCCEKIGRGFTNLSPRQQFILWLSRSFLAPLPWGHLTSSGLRTCSIKLTLKKKKKSKMANLHFRLEEVSPTLPVILCAPWAYIHRTLRKTLWLKGPGEECKRGVVFKKQAALRYNLWAIKCTHSGPQVTSLTSLCTHVITTTLRTANTVLPHSALAASP